jgi:uncharacterized lipoprotein YajG
MKNLPNIRAIKSPIQYKSALVLSISVFFLIACSEATEKADEKLRLLNEKVDQVNSLLNKEITKIEKLDSLAQHEMEKIGRLDSIIDSNATRIDTLFNR